MDSQTLIECNLDVLVGKPVVRGTRLSVEYLVELYATGWSEDQILENHPSLSKDGLRAAMAYAASCMRDEQIYRLSGP